MTGKEAWKVIEPKLSLVNDKEFAEAYILTHIALYQYDKNAEKCCANCEHWSKYDMSQDPIGWCAITCSGWMAYQYCSSFSRTERNADEKHKDLE